MSRWYRSHVGLVVDAKLGEAVLIAQCSRALVIAAWHAILESCAEVNDGGRFDTVPRRVAAILAEPVAALEAVFAAFADLGMIEAGHVKAWTRRQFESDSSTDQSRKHREAKRTGELMRGHSVEPPQRDETAVQRCATPPYLHSETETEFLPLSSSPVAACEPLDEPGGGFERFWQAMPSPNPATKAAALATFARLDAADRAKAVAAAGRYASAYAAKPTTHPLSPARFLRERCFEGYGPPGAAGAAGEAATVFVRVETPQWRAWTAHRGRAIPLNAAGTGWHFPSEWPPDCELGAA
jgi:hypothetical protein